MVGRDGQVLPALPTSPTCLLLLLPCNPQVVLPWYCHIVMKIVPFLCVSFFTVWNNFVVIIFSRYNGACLTRQRRYFACKQNIKYSSCDKKKSYSWAWKWRQRAFQRIYFGIWFPNPIFVYGSFTSQRKTSYEGRVVWGEMKDKSPSITRLSKYCPT